MVLVISSNTKTPATQYISKIQDENIEKNARLLTPYSKMTAAHTKSKKFLEIIWIQMFYKYFIQKIIIFYCIFSNSLTDLLCNLRI